MGGGIKGKITGRRGIGGLMDGIRNNRGMVVIICRIIWWREGKARVINE